jgi:hypothetical protein
MTATDAMTLHDLSLADLRGQRTAVRRHLELARMKGHAHDAGEQSAIKELQVRVQALTNELIDRYSADLALVDTLLAPPYARTQAPVSTPAPHRAGEP